MSDKCPAIISLFPSQVISSNGSRGFNVFIPPLWLCKYRTCRPSPPPHFFSSILLSLKPLSARDPFSAASFHGAFGSSASSLSLRTGTLRGDTYMLIIARCTPTLLSPEIILLIYGPGMSRSFFSFFVFDILPLFFNAPRHCFV